MAHSCGKKITPRLRRRSSSSLLLSSFVSGIYNSFENKIIPTNSIRVELIYCRGNKFLLRYSLVSNNLLTKDKILSLKNNSNIQGH